MEKKVYFMALLMMGMFAVSGCATTGRNNQADMDALNSKLSALEGQLSAKDQEISRLEGQMNDQRTALSQAEADKRIASDKLDQALSQLSAAQTRKATPAPKKEEASDLK